MKTAEDFVKETGILLDTDIQEQVPVRKVAIDSVDEKTNTARFSIRTVLETQTVRYMNVPHQKIRCKPGDHTFFLADPKKYIFACHNCSFACRVYPADYQYDEVTGKLYHYKTKRFV